VKWGIYHEAECLMHAIEDFAFVRSIDLRVTSYDVTLILGRDALWEVARGV